AIKSLVASTHDRHTLSGMDTPGCHGGRAKYTTPPKTALASELSLPNTKNMTFFHGRDILGPNVLLADAHGAADFR
ncbi:MAG: hypothetical protein OXG97_14930, partial [Candidatus Poribacteria bacterium]|nr:hypothetical protein [Candidatus Poribacteria bacterium]